MRKVGTYELLGTIARGGMAELHLARAKGLHGFEKTVVLKRIHPHLADDPDFVDMFLDEARLAAQLDHPNVVQVFDIGEGHDGVFFVMEHLDGLDLGQLVKRNGGPLPLEHVITIVAATAAGLHHAHRRIGSDGRRLSVIHRDVSPSNIFVTAEGAVKVVDVGIAKAATNRRETQESQIKGKVRYMSPEQCKGATLDARSDIFSLGTVLYQASTGRSAFTGDGEFDVMNEIVNGRVRPPVETDPGFPPALSRIIVKAMQPRPSDRYGSAEQMRKDLEAFAREQGYALSTGALAEFSQQLMPGRKETVDLSLVEAPPAKDATTAVSVPAAAAREGPTESKAGLLPRILASGAAAALVAGASLFFYGLLEPEVQPDSAAAVTPEPASERSPEPDLEPASEPASEPSPEPAPAPTPQALAAGEPSFDEALPAQAEPEPAPPKSKAKAKAKAKTKAKAKRRKTPSKPQPETPPNAEQGDVSVSGNEWVPIRQ